MTKKTKNKSKKLMKKEERQAEIERLRKTYAETIDFSITDFKVGELVDLLDKKKLTAKEEEKKARLQLEMAKAYGLKNGIWAINLGYERYHDFLATTRAC